MLYLWSIVLQLFYNIESMATFKVVVLPHQKKEDGTYNVKIRVTQNRRTKYIKTGQYVTSNDISRRKEKGVEKIRIKNQAVLDLMDGVVLSYRKKLMEAGSVSDQWDVDKVVEYLSVEHQSEFRLDIIEYGRKFADELEKQGRVGTAKQYRIAINALSRFAGEHLDVNDITVSFLKSYEKHIIQEPAYKGIRSGESVVTGKPKGGRAVSLYMSRLKFLFNQAKLEYNDEEVGKINIRLSPFERYKIPPVNQSSHRVLSVSQVQNIISLPYKDSRKASCSLFNLAKDVFVLSFGLMGMNTADMYEAVCLSDNILTYERRKTRTRRKDKALIKVRVEDELLFLFYKYKGMDCVFNFRERYKNPDIFNKMVNIGLKEIGSEIGVPDLNFYYARHSMASICANKLRIDIARVDEMLNHSDPKMALARVYIEKDFQPLWDANRRLLDLFDWSFYTKEKPEE